MGDLWAIAHLESIAHDMPVRATAIGLANEPAGARLSLRQGQVAIACGEGLADPCAIGP